MYTERSRSVHKIKYLYAYIVAIESILLRFNAIPMKLYDKKKSNDTTVAVANSVAQKATIKNKAVHLKDNRKESIAQRMKKEEEEAKHSFDPPKQMMLKTGTIAMPSITVRNNNSDAFQLKKQVFKSATLHGANGTIHYHITLDPNKLGSLHISFTDTATVSKRNWQFVYKYKQNSDSWTGPHPSSGFPSQALEVAESRLGALQADAVAIYRNVPAIKKKLDKRQEDRQRERLFAEDAFPDVLGKKPEKPKANVKAKSVSTSSMSATSPAFVPKAKRAVPRQPAHVAPVVARGPAPLPPISAAQIDALYPGAQAGGQPFSIWGH